MFKQEQYKTFETSTMSQLYYVSDGNTFYITTYKQGDNDQVMTGWFFEPKALVETAEFLLDLAIQLKTKIYNEIDKNLENDNG
jgi:hypothetical protein